MNQTSENQFLSHVFLFLEKLDEKYVNKLIFGQEPRASQRQAVQWWSPRFSNGYSECIPCHSLSMYLIREEELYTDDRVIFFT